MVGMHLQRVDGLTASDDPARLDLDRICRWLAASYWAGHRDRGTVERSLAGSSCYGAYTADGTQVAFTRAVTDGATFAWICDVVVDEAWRGRGIGTWLVGGVIADLRGGAITRLLLATRDAHGVYAPLGFEPLRTPAAWMEIDARPSRPAPAPASEPDRAGETAGTTP